MAEQKHIQGANNQDTPLYPVEGRVDVAGDVEEEQRDAYSAHHKMATSQTQKGAPPKSASASATSLNRANLPPVEGRVDVAGDIEEEQRNAYSSHHS